MEERQVIRSYKFGVGYLAKGQSTEEQMMSNKMGLWRGLTCRGLVKGIQTIPFIPRRNYRTKRMEGLSRRSRRIRK
jgi:hypothetical protein